jgi:hypothetical protein
VEDFDFEFVEVFCLFVHSNVLESLCCVVKHAELEEFATVMLIRDHPHLHHFGRSACLVVLHLFGEEDAISMSMSIGCLSSSVCSFSECILDLPGSYVSNHLLPLLNWCLSWLLDW